MCPTTTIVFTNCNHKDPPYTTDICSYYREYSELLTGSPSNLPMDPFTSHMQGLIGLCRGLATQTGKVMSIADSCPKCRVVQTGMYTSMKETAAKTAQTDGIHNRESDSHVAQGLRPKKIREVGKEDPLDMSFEARQRAQHRWIAKECLQDFDSGIVPMSAEKVEWLEQVLITGSSKGSEIYLADDSEPLNRRVIDKSKMRMPLMEGEEEEEAPEEGRGKGKATAEGKGKGKAPVDRKGKGRATE